MALICVLVRQASADGGVMDCGIPQAPGSSLALQISDALQRESGCIKNAGFLFDLGQKLNKSRQYAEAIDRLEAAILLDPRNWWAHLEYAIALEGVGDSASVDGILRNLLLVEEISPDLRQQIRAQLDKRQASLGPVLANRTQLGVVAGYDDNLLGAARVSSFDLTLPAGRVPVTLGQESRPKAGRFLRLNLEHEASLPVGSAGKLWSYSINANYRLSPDYSSSNFGLVQFSVERGNGAREGAYTNFGFVSMQAPAGALLRYYKLGAGYEALGFNALCRLRAGGELEYRNYPNGNTLNGRYLGGVSYAVCPALGFQAQMRIGQDNPEYDIRAGSTQNQYSLRLGKNTTLGSGNLVTELEFYRQEDQRGFSPLLENNLKRTINRTLYRIEYRSQKSELGPYIGIEHVDQSANLALFRVSNQVIYVGMRTVW